MDVKNMAMDYRLSQWAQIIKERAESGLSVKKFSKKNKISENSFYYWQRKLRKTACEMVLKQSNACNSLVPSGFTEIRITEPQTPSEIYSNPLYQVNIELRGVKISASNEYPTDKIIKLLREVAHT